MAEGTEKDGDGAKEPKSEATGTPEANKPVSKTVEWALAIAIMTVLALFLAWMISFMRSARAFM